MKKTLLLFLVFTLYGCEELIPSAAETIASSIEISYAEGDSISGITQDIVLPTSTDLNVDAIITWESLNESVIASDGTVQRTEEDTSVTLVMRVNVNGLYAQKIFNVTVLGLPQVTSFTVTLNVFDNIQTYTLTDALQLSDIQKPSVEGYVFMAWLDRDGNTIEDTFLINNSIELIASFEAVVTAQYTIEIYEQNLDEQFELKETRLLTDIVGETVRFDEDIEGFNMTTSSVTEIVLEEADNILKIYYERETYQVTFYNNNTVIKIDTYLFEDVAQSLILGNDIIGWSLYQGGPLFDFSTKITEDLSLYAVYETNEVSYTGYYASLQGVNDSNLYQAIETLIQDYRYVSYGDARDILQDSDEDPNNPNNIILVYNRASVVSTWDSGATWNREHVWPRSLLSNSTAEADPHNLKPSNPSINSSRGNDQFADSNGTYGRVSGGWFPGEQDKGDVARIVFYVSIMWERQISIIGNLNTFLQWHQEDPVDDFEENRNDIISEYTENRNPFVDHPELVNRLYGQPSNAPFYLNSTTKIYNQYLVISNESWIEKNTSN